MGDRYALGLIARSVAGEAELARVGSLSRLALAYPYKALRGTYDRVWRAPDPATAFDSVVRSQTSLQFLRSNHEHEISEQPRVGLSVDEIRNWCMDKLRPVLRQEIHDWMNATPPSDRDEYINARDVSMRA